VLFAKGNVSNAMYYTMSGAYRLVEIDKAMPVGEVVGEIGLIAPDNRRTLTFECVEEGELLTITYAQVKQLYYQNPEIGFYFLQLTSARLFQDIRRLEEQVAKQAA
jgi:CRP-like cAMP-binding protein